LLYKDKSTNSDEFEAISGEFDTFGISNTLWAFATLKVKPGALIFQLIEACCLAFSFSYVYAYMYAYMYV
jgi:hypothetical protein